MKTLSIFLLTFIGFFKFSDGLETKVDCNSYAADQMAVVEEHFGCLDSDTYNEGFENIYLYCEMLDW